MKRSRKSIGTLTQLGAGFFKGDTFYGAFQELGWKAGKRNRRKVLGLHFMQRAARQVGRKAGAVATNIIKNVIIEESKKNG